MAPGTTPLASPHSAPQQPLETEELPWQDFPWPASLGLQERQELLTYVASCAEDSAAKAQKRLKRWQSQAPFDDPEWRRLRFQRVGDTSRWLELLATPSALEPRPEWVDRLAALYASSASRTSPRSPHPLKLAGFSVLLEPLVSFAAGRLQEMLQNLALADSSFSDRVDSNAVHGSMCMMLARDLNRLVSPTLVLELRIASLEARLSGETAQERYDDFVRSLAEPRTAEQIFRQYPVLARQVMACIDRTLDPVRELMVRLTIDHPSLESSFGHALGPLVRLVDSGGDPHRGGRRVCFLGFESGRRLVYKPRPMAVEEAFQEFLRWAGGRFSDVPRSVQILDRGDYGYMEWLEPRPCETEAEVESFYRRQGVLLAFLHLFGATDLHLENVLADGDSPVALDLETLLHPHLPRFGTEDAEVGELDDTVLRVGLLPNRLIHRGEEQLGLDASGLGAQVGEKTPKGAVRVEGGGTDEMRLVSASGEIRSTPGRPTLAGEPVDPIAFAGHVEAGFRSARRSLIQHREELADAGGPLEIFRGLSTRVVLRPTHTYAKLLTASSHPHFLADAVSRDRHFDRLWLGLRVAPWMANVVDAECLDLRQGDIPSFSARTDSLRLRDAAGEDCGEVLIESGFDGLMRRLEALNESSTERQATIVHQSFELRAAERRRRPRPRSRLVPPGLDAPPISRDEFLDMAFRAADQLRQRAFVDATGARWLMPRRLGHDRWALAEAGPDLYDGMAGICLFLSTLAHVGGREQDSTLAAAAAASLTHQLTLGAESSNNEDLRRVGAYIGWGGVIHTLCRLASLQRDATWLDLAVDQLPRMEALLPEDKSFDVVGGSAGAALVFCELARLRPRSPAARLARQSGEQLLSHAIPQRQGLGWPPPDSGPAHPAANEAPDDRPAAPLGGLSHGASGIAWALIALAHLPDLPRELEERFWHTALGALEYEDTLFDEHEGNWRDTRPRPGSEQGFLAAWCHGAPGIGMARLAIADSVRPHDLEGDNARLSGLKQILLRDLDRAICHTLEKGFGLTHSLCHGDLGNLDFLIEVSELARQSRGADITQSDGGSLQAEVSRLARSVTASVHDQGFLFGSPGGTEPPGLMLGVAGIGYGFLRLAAPDSVPSVLRLAQFPGQDGSLLRSMVTGLTLNESGGHARLS